MVYGKTDISVSQIKLQRKTDNERRTLPDMAASCSKLTESPFSTTGCCRFWAVGDGAADEGAGDEVPALVLVRLLVGLPPLLLSSPLLPTSCNS